MKVGIVGLPASGKTTLFGALTRATVKTGFGGHAKENLLGVIPVPDPRFDRLVAMYHPRKEVPAVIEFVDAVGGIESGASRSRADSDLYAAVREADTLVVVVRCFTSDAIPHPSGSLNPVRDARAIVAELILGDLVLIERRLERLDKQMAVNRSKMTAEQIAQVDLLKRLKEALESEIPVRRVEMTRDEARLLRELEFLSAKPAIFVANIDESDIGRESRPAVDDLLAYGEENGYPSIDLCVEAEMEVAQLGEAEESEFLSAMGIEEPARGALIRMAYEQLGFLSFFTVGEDEVRAWTLRKGQTAVDAAGKIHTDLAKGFIRAEVVSYDHLIECGTMNAAKEKGHWRLEGKEYVVKDGDILNIRFQVSK